MVVTFIVPKNWTHTPSASGSYGRLAGWQADENSKGLTRFQITYTFGEISFENTNQYLKPQISSQNI